jgi:uncharacterized membrane protein YhaH (DUF805 family)
MIDDKSLKNIEKLHQLKTDGVITLEEFEKSKDKILFGAKPCTIGTFSEVETPKDDDYLGWMILPLRRYADFNGRSGRREFWMFQLLYASLFVATAVIVSLNQNEYGETGTIGHFAIAMMFIAIIGLIVPLIAVEVRRFHDQDKSGWLAALNLIPYLGVLIVLVFMLMEGTSGENRFGPSPK